MARFHMTFTPDAGGQDVELTTGRTTLWEAQDYGATIPDTPSKDSRVDFAWAYFAARKAGRLADLGISEDTPTDEAVGAIADSYGVNITREQAPLAQGLAES